MTDATQDVHGPVRRIPRYGVVVLVLSLWPPLAFDADAGAQSKLATMQVVTAASCAFVLTRSVRPSLD